MAVIIIGLVIYIVSVMVLCEYFPKIYWPAMISIVILLIIISGIRYDVGIDYLAYKEIYDNVTEEWMLFQLEPLWQWLIPSLRVCGFSSRAWFLITSIFINILYFVGIKRMSNNIIFSLLLYIIISTCYLESFNAVRQFAAGVILFSTFHYVIEGRMKKYIFCVLLAMCFHYSALIMLLFVLIARCKIPNLATWVVYCLSFILGTSVLPVIINYVLPYITEYAGYADSQHESYSGGLKLLYFIIGCIIILAYKKAKGNDYIYFNLALLAYIWYFIFIDIQVFCRCMWYLTPFLTIVIPKVISSFSTKSRLIITPFVVLLYLFVTLKMYYEIPYNWDIRLFY